MDIQYFVLEAQVLIKIAGIVFFVGHHFWHQPVEAGEKKMSWDVFHIQFLLVHIFKGVSLKRWRRELLGIAEGDSLVLKEQAAPIGHSRIHTDTLLETQCLFVSDWGGSYTIVQGSNTSD